MNPLDFIAGGIGKALFGDKGLTGTVVDTLKDACVLKDREGEERARLALLAHELHIADKSASIIASINATMQAESKSEHWPQWAWRPTVGFTFAGAIINNYILYAYFASYGMVKVEIPSHVWEAMLVILGAAAFTR